MKTLKLQNQSQAVIALNFPLHSKAFLTGSMLSLAGMLVLGVFNYLIRRALLFDLDAQAFGFLYASLALFALCLSFAEFGMSKAGTILIAKYLANRQKSRAEMTFGIHMAFNGITSGLFMVLLAATSIFIVRDFFNYPQGFVPFLLFLPYVFATAVESSFLTYLNASKNFLCYVSASNLRAIVTLAGCLIFAKSMGLFAMPFVFIASILASIAFIWLFIRKTEGVNPVLTAIYGSRTLRAQLFSLGAWVAVSNAGLACLYNMNTLCLAGMDSLDSVALYNIAIPIMQIALSLILVVPMVFTPFAAEMVERNEFKNLRRSCFLLSLLIVSGVPVVFVLGHYFAGWLITVLFSVKFVAAAETTVILCCAALFFAIAQLHFSVLNSAGRGKSTAIYAISGAVLNLLLCLLLIPHFKIEGAAIASLVSYFGISAAAFLEVMAMTARC